MTFRVEELNKLEGIVHSLDVEANYHVPAEGKDLEDAVLFETRQEGGEDDGIDTLIACSVADARKFAEKILMICEEIEGTKK